MSAHAVPKTRSRMITGWRQAPAPARGPKWKKPATPAPRDKAAAEAEPPATLEAAD